MKNKTTVFLGVMLTLLIVLAASLAYYFIYFKPSVKMVDMSNMTVEEVKEFFNTNNITEDNYEITYEYSETVEKDKVISQSLEEGKEIKKDTVISIEISNGKDPNLEVEIPDFTDKTEEEITSWFETNLFTDVTYEYVLDEKEKGKFVSLNVDNNLQKRSALIIVSISAGKDAIGIEIDLPDFKDYTKANIQAWAKTNNVSVTFKTEASNTIASDKVISQNPKGGTKIKTGDKITVTLSTGKGITAISFAGKTKAEAEKWIKQNGLKANYINIYDGKVAEGLIISNNPNSGTIKAGGTVQFNLSIGLVPVENYTNKTRDEFNSYINKLNSTNNKSANIKVSIVEEESTKAAGTILSQLINNKQVSGQSKVAPGTTITIKVAKAQLIKVDNKAGSSENDFKNYLTGLGLKVGNKSERYDDSKASGILISNDTGSYSAGSSVNYTVSIGKYSIDANSYNNKPYSELVNTINNANNKGAGFSVNKSDEANSTTASGNIISCSVSGKTVTCKVSSGAPITVKNYRNQTKPCNESCTIERVIYKITYEYSDTINKNIVINQSIEPGTVVSPNTNVTLTVSQGKKPEELVEVNNHVGQTCGKSCSTNGKNYKLTYSEEYSDTVAVNTIISQSVAAGTKIKPGETVNLVVSLGAKPNPKCTVPNSIIRPGYNAGSYDTAVSEINSNYSEFTVNIVTLNGETNNPSNLDGVIKSISAQPNTELDCGSTITFEVYKK